MGEHECTVTVKLTVDISNDIDDVCCGSAAAEH